MRIKLEASGMGKSVLILTPENHGDELKISLLEKTAKELNQDVHRWNNEDGNGLTFFLAKERP